MSLRYFSTHTARSLNSNLSLARLWNYLSSELYVSSFFVLGGTVISAGFGFIFWMLAVRFTSPADVGLTSAAITSSILLVALSDIGLTPAFIYYASSEKQPSALLNTTISASWLLSSVVTVTFLLGLPLWSPSLLPIRHEWQLLCTFIGFTSFNHIMGLQDVAMLAQKQPQHIFWRNLICNGSPLLLLVPFVEFFGYFKGLMLAYMLPNIVVGIFISLLILPRHFPDYRFWGKFNYKLLIKMRNYGLVNHISNLLWSLPAYSLPLIAVNLISPEATAYFAIAWAIVNALLIIPRAATITLFVEGARQKNGDWQVARHSLLLILALGLPLLAILWFFGEYVLALFGPKYINMTLLRILLLSFVPFTVNNVFFVSLRVQERLSWIIYFTASIAICVLASAIFLGQRIDIEGIAWGWLLGHLLPMLFVLLLSIPLKWRVWVPLPCESRRDQP